MKKLKIALLTIVYLVTINVVIAQSNHTKEIEAPKWEDYVSEKYHHPRSDFKRKSTYWEMASGFILTDLIITAPIGIPLIAHSFSKLKNISYSDRKKKFEQGLIFANSIDDPQLKQEFYKTLLKDCKLSERKKQKLAKKQQKQIERDKRKAQKEQEKANKLKEISQKI